jgi:alpha-N-arabinofuranosidase
MLRPDLLQALRDLAPPFIRWPGGSFASTYKWKDGIGPYSSRVYHPNEIWGGYSDYYGFGTNEFMELTRQLGADPLVVLPAPNTDAESVEYAMDWVHYLIDPATTTLGSLRAKNGHPDPYRVPYFPDRQRADEQQLHRRTLRRRGQRVRQPASQDCSWLTHYRVRAEAIE